MNYRKFLAFSILSAALWGAIMPTIGYLFGTNPFIRENIIWFIYGIAILTLATVVIITLALVHGFFRSRTRSGDDQQE
jgi:membrane-associated protein